MLALDNVSARYDQLTVLKKITLHVNQGEAVSLLGANGAGKTSILRTITGGIVVSSGSIQFEGKDITKWPGYLIVRERIAHVPENRRVFKELSVEDNLILGGYLFSMSKSDLRERLEKVYSLFPRLRERTTQLAGTMSGGEQQMLAIGRGLMMDPKFIIMDEPSQGLAPKIVEEIFSAIRKLKQEGKTILLVEQNIFQALQISDRAYIIKNGEVIMEGKAEELLSRPDIKEAYLQ
jgi:branched-chain amino acid transport system ATP-binding protein